jgi:hypothetical protein
MVLTSISLPQNFKEHGHKNVSLQSNKQTNSVALVCEWTIPTERLPLVGEVSANFCGYGCRVVSATDPMAITQFSRLGMSPLHVHIYIHVFWFMEVSLTQQATNYTFPVFTNTLSKTMSCTIERSNISTSSMIHHYKGVLHTNRTFIRNHFNLKLVTAHKQNCICSSDLMSFISNISKEVVNSHSNRGQTEYT